MACDAAQRAALRSIAPAATEAKSRGVTRESELGRIFGLEKQIAPAVAQSFSGAIRRPLFARGQNGGVRDEMTLQADVVAPVDGESCGVHDREVWNAGRGGRPRSRSQLNV